MTHQEIVRDRYPGATARQFLPAYRYGRVAPMGGGWTVYPTEALGASTLGTGATQEGAWADAAAEIAARRSD